MTVSSFADTAAVSAPVQPVRRGRVEFLRYFACSAAALALDTGIYALLLAVQVPYSLAAAVGFVAGLCLAYGLSVRYVFGVRSVADARAEFTIFAAIGVFGLLLTELLLWLLIGRLQLPPVAAKLISAGLVFLSNFGLRKLFLFTPRKPEPAIV